MNEQAVDLLEDPIKSGFHARRPRTQSKPNLESIERVYLYKRSQLERKDGSRAEMTITFS